MHGRIVMDTFQIAVAPSRGPEAVSIPRGRLVTHKDCFIADQRGAVSFEMLIVFSFLLLFLLLPLADVAVAGFKYISAYQALRDMGQRTQYSTLDVTDPQSISAWQSSFATTRVSGYTISATIKCGAAPGTDPPCAATTFPKYYYFQTSFSLSPMVLGSVLCSSCRVDYSERFQ
jgi:hypothetical protein